MVPDSRRALAVVLVFAVSAAASAARAIRPLAEQAKIDFLLGEVESSPAVFIRNGREYPARRAASHLRSKLRFAGRRVRNARQFIVGVASRSEASGKPYEIRWPEGRRQPLADWLLERLELYESRTLPAPRPRSR